jgi:ribonuclease HII
MLRSHYSSDLQIIECGCDEAGRGCMAGPVSAAAVILPPDYHNDRINDSKQLSRKVREELRKEIERDAVAYAVVFVSPEEIDQVNILSASLLGMNRAVQQLTVRPQLLLIDGNRFRNQTGIPYQCVVKGDATFLSIAAASILAKTYRDELMYQLDSEYPMYGWKVNVGYPTRAHQEAIIQYGLTPYHRKSFHLKRLTQPSLFDEITKEK